MITEELNQPKPANHLELFYFFNSAGTGSQSGLTLLKKYILNLNKIVSCSSLTSKSGQVGLRRILKTFQFVRLGNQQVAQLNTSLARLGKQLKPKKTSKPAHCGLIDSWKIL